MLKNRIPWLCHIWTRNGQEVLQELRAAFASVLQIDSHDIRRHLNLRNLSRSLNCTTISSTPSLCVCVAFPETCTGCKSEISTTTCVSLLARVCLAKVPNTEKHLPMLAVVLKIICDNQTEFTAAQCMVVVPLRV